ncbi:RNA polymerase subunit sigma-24 [Elizabethkingia bruuniana]|nr:MULTISPECIES: sigma-70 family RNA polymerase sigma factor [Elizabethkingia]ATL45584.1 sigma-70 family RNA polymerase sigma factor [Elizabethkingia miricola]AQX87254.1 RNA polymerase subunit sigma-24 [Elizabethkingia bruuniana]KGO11850.1 RNA polymerase subunit sigma-24 [Elizabethkingia miricola]KUY22364.1 RNA polymerase subunit sigma-24 [Elizabethkingia bruuniana]OPB62578.1 RNA polymerase subunit sigma-24 [Elizabethkingia bruuniana]
MNTQENFENIYRQYAPGIRKLCLSYTGDMDNAEDLLQETFITVWKNLNKFRNDSKLSTWIYRIAVNNCLMTLRKQKNISRISEEKIVGLPDEVQQDKTQDTELLYKCISELKEADRVIITLVLDEKPYEEIAEITGITENNLRVKIHRIKKELTEIFQQHARL